MNAFKEKQACRPIYTLFCYKRLLSPVTVLNAWATVFVVYKKFKICGLGKILKVVIVGNSLCIITESDQYFILT